MFWWASDRPSGASDSTVLRRFAVSVGRARRRASSAELRQFLVLIACRRGLVAEKCRLPVAWLVLILVFCLSVNLFVFMDSLFINSGRGA